MTTFGIVALFVLVASCSSDNDVPPPIQGSIAASFRADTPTPAASTLTLQSKDSTGAVVRIAVVVTGVDDFYGATFDLTYDSSVIQFDSLDASATFLLGGGVTASDLIVRSDPVPGGREITITRQGSQFAGVSMTPDQQGELGVIQLRALRTSAGPVGVTDLQVSTCTATDCDQKDASDVPPSGGRLTAS